MINPKKLTSELLTAGISISGCSDKGIVWDSLNKEIQTRADVKAVIAKHDPTPVVIVPIEDRVKALESKISILESK